MVQDNQVCCGNCAYGARVAPDSIVCHRYPPHITSVENAQITTHFPLVHSQSWCGEWKMLPRSKRSQPYEVESTQ